MDIAGFNKSEALLPYILDLIYITIPISNVHFFHKKKDPRDKDDQISDPPVYQACKSN